MDGAMVMTLVVVAAAAVTNAASMTASAGVHVGLGKTFDCKCRRFPF